MAPKVDPETLVIRASPLRAIRFKRKVVIGITTVGVIALVGVTGIALKPSVFKVIANGEDKADLGARAPADALSALPKTYGDVPRLGPPLPGDLGGPILERQQQLLTDGSGVSPPLSDAKAQAEQAAQAERERQLADLKAARRSALLVQSGGRIETAASPASASTDLTAATDAGEVALDPERDPNGQQRKSDFLARSVKEDSVDPHMLTRLVSPYLLSAGTVIAGSLITGIRSDLPGLVTAQVIENVFDSATGRILLVPQGARLIGKYDSVVAYGQKRALVVWQRIVLPDGSSLGLDNVPASDASGYAGLADKVDGHSWALLKGVVISTLLGVGSELQFSGGSGLVQAIRQSGQQNVAHAGDQLTSKTLNVQPTITIRSGTPVRLVVQKDLILAPWRG
ncbi:TrbI/VirB10 family protein [Sphingomonas sp. RB1R13]|uniref:TrbI/VirB10 family protein n=1 Tax=Sphingomonas sp. RB1R13 TaxID=3096159 RepID=UPI002FCA344F